MNKYNWNNCMGVLSAWSLDFTRAMMERPMWARLLVRLAFGKYAYREFMGMVGVVNACFEFNEYMLEDVNYHKEELPVKWWNWREYSEAE